MADPVTSLHYTSNSNFVNGQYAPRADGFNLADISSASELSELPSGVKALVWLGMTGGVTAAFTSAVESYARSSQVYGFYLADEPSPSATTAANFKAESDWIHANFPGAKTFIIEQDLSSELTPSFYYTPANTDIDLFGLDPYPVNSDLRGGYDLNIIPLAVHAAERVGIPQQDLVPVYQAFGGGGYSQWTVPTPVQEQQILSTWSSVVPNPAFDYAYSWGVQAGDTALSTDPSLQQVFAAHNASWLKIGGNGSGGTVEKVNASRANVEVEANSNVQLTGSIDTVKIDPGVKSNLILSGSSDTVAASAGDAISLTSGAGDTITGAGLIVAAASGTGLKVGGNGTGGTVDNVQGSRTSVEVEANSNVQLTGSTDTVKIDPGVKSNLILSGSSDTVAASAGDAILLTSGTGDTITGAGLIVAAASGTGLKVGGNGTGGTVDNVQGSRTSVEVEANSNVQLTGSIDTVKIDPGVKSNLILSGSSDTVAASAGDAISLTSGTGDTITGAGLIVAAASGTGLKVGGNGTGGTVEKVNASRANVEVEANSNVQLTGSTDTIKIDPGVKSSLILSGSSDTVAVSAGDGISLTSGTGDKFTGSEFTVSSGTGTGFTIIGTGDVVYAGLDDAITDSGSSTTIKIQSNVGRLKVFDFGTDPTGIIDLLRGVGGYTTSAQVREALTSDGSGGTLLSLGGDGSIDFVHITASSLHAGNFKIG